MVSFVFYFILSLAFGGVNVSAQILQKCKMNDEECILKSARALYSQIITGVPKLGIESSDPIFVDIIKSDLSTLKYTSTDSYISGYKDCTIDNLKSDFVKMSVVVDMSCPRFVWNGTYEISGRLIILPVEGKGAYWFKSQKYHLNIELELKTATGKDGKNHLKIKYLKSKVEALEPILFQLDNLFNGQKDLSDAVHKFANENWKEVSNFVQEPSFKVVFKKIISHFNKYLKTVSYEDLILY